ncbi:diguanylate cyclase [Bacillus freudenreichii]|nr:diguanylate cyclase [Bacillus freudenreichii]
MGFRGRFFSVFVVALFNVLRYFYYHYYLGLPFKADFFILTAIFMSIAWWCGKQYDRAKYYSEKDALTNTFNRRTVERKFNALYKKHDRKVGVVMIDLNDFKKINDCYGHNKGDEVLRIVGTRLNEIVKKEDCAARWGGDEFLLLINNPKADFKADRIKMELEELELVSVSIGTAVFPDHGNTLEKLIQYADAKLYEMKEP